MNFGILGGFCGFCSGFFGFHAILLIEWTHSVDSVDSIKRSYVKVVESNSVDCADPMDSTDSMHFCGMGTVRGQAKCVTVAQKSVHFETYFRKSGRNFVTVVQKQ